MTRAGPAIPVVASNQAPSGEAALRVAIVSDGRAVEAGPARPIIEVFDNRPTQANEPLPIVVSRGNGFTLAGPPIPVRVTSGYLPSAYGAKVQAIAPANLLAYWPLDELSGSVITDRSGSGRNGVYSNTTYGSPGPDGRPCAGFNGTSSFGNLYSASLAGAFNGQEGSFSMWCRMANAGVWTDGVTRRALYFLVDASNRAGFFKPTTANEMDCLYVAGGTSLAAGKGTFSPTDWFHLGQTWSKSNNQMIFYVGGVAITPISTGLGTFAGALSAVQTILGSLSTTPAQNWSGFEADVAVWSTPLTAAQMAALAGR
jgi:hypothetical protein